MTTPERIERIQARAEEQREARRRQPACAHDGGAALFVYVFANGSKHVAEGCVRCKKELTRWHKQVSDDGLPIAFDDRIERPPCVRCGAWGTELHHFAPKALFGDWEADRWPTAWLCPPCHAFWHDTLAKATAQPALFKAS